MGAINLRLEIDYEYVLDETVTIFNRYKWALQRIGVQLAPRSSHELTRPQSLLEAIVYCPANNDRTVDGVLRLVAVPQSIGAVRARF